ncbi:MAG: DUF5989 family protein [Acidobacteriota bacterium]|nr:DUF5989 family protein [Acidobacteriota bacterium]
MSKSEFEQEAGAKRESFLREFVHFLGDNKKWWMIPILLVLLLVGALLIAGGSGVAPFIYTLF